MTDDQVGVRVKCLKDQLITTGSVYVASKGGLEMLGEDRCRTKEKVTKTFELKFLICCFACLK